MGKKSNPSSRAYPTPTYISSHITTRENIWWIIESRFRTTYWYE